MEEGLKIQIGADVTELINGFSKATKLLQSFAQTGEASAKDVEKAIRQLSKATKGLSGEELERVNTLIAKLRDTSAQLGKQATTGVQALGGSLQDLSKDAATVTPQIEKLSTAITAIPEGAFSVSLDADVAAYLPKIEGASEALRQLGLTGIIAGDQAEGALIELGRAAENAGTADLLKLNAAIAAIGTASEKFRSTGANAFDAFGNAVENAAKKVSIVGPAISNAVKEVEVVKAQGFTIKINAETQQAIQGLKFIGKETRELGVTGQANVKQVENALKDLNKQLKGGGGGAAEVERLKIAISGLKSAASNFNVDGSVKNLGVLETKAKSVKAAVTDLNGTTVTTTFNTQGVEQSTSKVEILNAAVDKAEAQPDISFKLTVEDTQAIGALITTSKLIQEIGKTGVIGLNQVAQVLDELKIAASGLSGGALENINRIINEIQVSVAGLGGTATQVFDKLGNAINGVDGTVTITPVVNSQTAVNNLDVLENKIFDVKDSIIEIQKVAAKGTTPFDIPGIQESRLKVAELKRDIGDLRNASEFKLDLSVDARNAIKNVGATDAALERLSRTGKASLKDVQQGIRFLTEAAKKPGAQIDKINAALQQLTGLGKQLKNVGKDGFDKLGLSVETASKRLRKVNPAAASASDALRDMGRVVQDAPFGLIGIANNIDPLIQSLGNLNTAAAGTGGAFKALGGALMGPAGIAFAVSAITSLAVAAVQKYGSLGRAISDVFGLISNLEQAQYDLAKSFAEAQGGVAGEIASINALVATAKDETLSKKARQNAINELNNSYDDYLPKLTLENIGTQKVTDSVNKLTASLIRQAKIKGLQDLISKESAKVFEDINNQLNEGDGLLDNIVNFLKSPILGASLPALKTDAFIQGLGKAADKIDFFQNALNGLIKENAVEGPEVKDNSSKKVKEGTDLIKDRISALTELRNSIGLTAAKEQELLGLMLIDKTKELKKAGIAGQELADVLSKVKADFKIEGIDLAIKKIEQFKGEVDLMGKDKAILIDLKLNKFDLEFPKATEEQRRQAYQKMINEVNQSNKSEPIVVPIKTFFELQDKPEDLFKKVEDLIPEGGFVIPISIANAVAPLPTTLNDPTTEATAEQELDKKIAKTKEYATVVSQELTPVFTSLFDTIGKGGQSAFQALGDAIKGILKKLAAAVIQAAIFAAIMAAIPGGGGFASAFGGQIGNLTGITGLFGSKPNQANLNRSQVRGNAANLGRETLVAQVSGNDLNFILRRNNTSNSRFA